ncbi:hypothetical protein F4803DRAFT_204758 [Xylaria telfairii]|nr:hypothetical protein F4803DRAFT_204758 [Xylaria telfairii]
MPRSEQPSFSPRAVGGRKFVAFFHPAYPYPAPPLLTLAAVDRVSDGGQVIKGIDYDIAKAACGIIACNRFDDNAYFALKSGEHCWLVVDRPADGLLRASGDFTFYFVVDSVDHRYPVVPSFDHWRFPHGALPLPWASLSPPGTEGARDSEPPCFNETDFARFAPFSHVSWCASNQMERYCQRHSVDATSLSRLISDIGHYFPVNRSRSRPRSHRPRRYELHPDVMLRTIMEKVFYDHRMVNSCDFENDPPGVTGIHGEHLFARFAFHVLSEANYRFLGGALKYTVRLFDIENAEHYTTELYSDDITEISRIFPLPSETSAYEHDEYAESDESCEDGDSICSSEGARSVEDPRHDAERRIGRRRYRSPAYYEYRRRWEASQQSRDDTGHVELIQDRDAKRSHHASSIGGLSLSSTVSVLSLETPRAGRTPEGAVGHEDNSTSSAGVVRSKRPYDDYNEAPDSSRSPKRLCLRSGLVINMY